MANFNALMLEGEKFALGSCHSQTIGTMKSLWLQTWVNKFRASVKMQNEWITCFIWYFTNLYQIINISVNEISYLCQIWMYKSLPTKKKKRETTGEIVKQVINFLTPWRWRWYVPLKHWALSELHGITTEKTIPLIPFNSPHASVTQLRWRITSDTLPRHVM
jgi:hypothetical protein